MGRKTPDLDALVTTIQTAMETRATLPAAEMRLARKHLEMLRPRLQALGFEVTSSRIRRPLVTQLLDALDAGFVPMQDLPRRVEGASAKEVKAAVETILSDGRAREVMRVPGPGILLASRANGAVIDPADLATLLRHLANAQRLVKRAVAKSGARSRRAVLRDDVMGPLLAFGNESSPERPTRAPAPRLAVERADVAQRNSVAPLTQTIRGKVENSERPLRVPELLRSLHVDREAGKRALVEGASAGLFGLEPESGMARLAPSDAEWCPAGPQGTFLSWVVARHQKGAPAR